MERKITALERQKKNPNRVTIYLDGEFAFGLSRLHASGLINGQLLTEEKIRELKFSDVTDLGMQKAMNFLRYRSRSEQEIHHNLRKHDFPDDVIIHVTERLRQLNLVNDINFAAGHRLYKFAFDGNNQSVPLSEAIGARYTNLYAGEHAVTKDALDNTTTTVRLQVPNLGIGTDLRFKLGDYIEIDA